jgi:hypothetical protein
MVVFSSLRVASSSSASWRSFSVSAWVISVRVALRARSKVTNASPRADSGRCSGRALMRTT